MIKRNIYMLRYAAGQIHEMQDEVVEEFAITIYINGRETDTLLCSPANLTELAVGRIFTSGVINIADEVKKINVDIDNGRVDIEANVDELRLKLIGKRIITSGCGNSPYFSSLSTIKTEKLRKTIEVFPEDILSYSRMLQKSSNIFRDTGGVHSAAIFESQMTFFAEDIGRHNAADKVIGYKLMNNLSDRIMVISGRLSLDMAIKAVRSGIEILISSSAPTTAAISFALNYNLTLIGFCRGERFNIYSGDDRIKNFLK
ncbi:MAG: formate dehydrogenase accessory sulfurtransferase FdhD [Thermoanaerobacteraceae bacterium]|nr:formate dehydrogenase accessory sulfurtransferase FdhD [Thermoanaerobacteraceae bacterium]